MLAAPAIIRMQAKSKFLSMFKYEALLWKRCFSIRRISDRTMRKVQGSGILMCWSTWRAEQIQQPIELVCGDGSVKGGMIVLVVSALDRASGSASESGSMVQLH